MNQPPEPRRDNGDFPRGGELGARMREKNWSETPLGPVGSWPPSLRASVGTCLNCALPIVLWWGPDLAMLYNDAFSRVMGANHPEGLGQPAREAWPELWVAIGPLLDRVLTVGEAVSADEFRLPLERDGNPEERWFSFSLSPIYAESGGVGGVFCPVVETTDQAMDARRSRDRAAGGSVAGIQAPEAEEDITERKRAEHDPRAAHDTFFHLVRSSPFGIYAVNADFRMVQVSAGAEKIFENVRPLLGRDFAEVLRCIWPEPFASEAIGRFRHTLATGEPYHAPSSVERRRDSGMVESYDWKIERVMLPDGRFGVVCHFYDLSERQRYEAALRASEERERGKAEEMEALMAAVPAVVMIAHDPECRVISGSRAAHELLRVPLGANLSKTGPTSERPRHFKVFKDGVELPADALPMQLAVKGIEVRDFEEEIRFEEGGSAYLFGAAIPLRDSRGRVRGAVSAFIDITERKRFEQALREADRQKDEFLATLAHELRNPLAPLLNGLEILGLARQGTEAVDRALGMMERQLRHMVRLIDDLLDLSRVSRGRIELRKTRVELGEIVHQAVEASRPLIVKSGHELRLGLPTEPVFVEADETRIIQVIANLLDNAAKYTDGSGLITLSIERRNREAVVEVRDNGIGIPPAMLPRVFEMFTQVERSLEKSRGGLGIGLSLAKRLVELHGGTVEARSEGHGKGSEFIVRLPAPDPRGPEPRDPGLAGACQGIPRAHRILVVDDNLDAATSLAMMLEILGYEIRLAHDGLEAIVVAEEFRPELILLDIGMPVLNGYATCRRMREVPWGRDILIVALTGWGQDEDRRQSREAGFNQHLVKPVEFSALESLLAALSEPKPGMAWGASD